MTAVVEAESLTKRFGEVPAVTELSFALEAGTITGMSATAESRNDDAMQNFVTQLANGRR
jgi:ABC-type Na+ transport system ATPase subunit NatA